jgi:hypothetical protein
VGLAAALGRKVHTLVTYGIKVALHHIEWYALAGSLRGV